MHFPVSYRLTELRSLNGRKTAASKPDFHTKPDIFPESIKEKRKEVKKQLILKKP
jgi:hypothetical protein